MQFHTVDCHLSVGKLVKITIIDKRSKITIQTQKRKRLIYIILFIFPNLDISPLIFHILISISQNA